MIRIKIVLTNHDDITVKINGNVNMRTEINESFMWMMNSKLWWVFVC